MKRIIRILGVVSGIIAFIVDVVAFLEIFGIRLIIRPSVSPVSFHGPPIILKVPGDAETITFLVWLYFTIIVVVIAKHIVEWQFWPTLGDLTGRSSFSSLSLISPLQTFGCVS